MNATTTELNPVQRLTKDLKDAAKTLSQREARYLVDTYYGMQEFRKAAGNQVFALSKSQEPHAVLQWFFNNAEALEAQIKRALDAYAQNSPIGRWALSIVGIGPVISAGLLAYINMEYWKCHRTAVRDDRCTAENPHPGCGNVRATTVGHIWRLAGLDPSQVWVGREKMEGMWSSCLDYEEGDPIRAAARLALQLNRRPMDVLASGGVMLPFDRGELHGALAAILNIGGDVVDKAYADYPVYIDNVITHLVAGDKDKVVGVYKSLVNRFSTRPGVPRLDAVAMKKAQSRRPWNAGLKVLCWKIGQSFLKTMNHEDSMYGRLFQERWAYEQQRNASGALADQAKKKLEQFRIGKKTEAYKHYSEGHLPPAHILQRSLRWTTKLFLSHWHQVAYEVTFGEKAPASYAIAHLGHTDVVPIPNWPL